jgi:hypothetical protein
MIEKTVSCYCPFKENAPAVRFTKYIFTKSMSNLKDGMMGDRSYVLANLWKVFL